MAKKIVVFITTYKRADLLLQLLKDIKCKSKNFDIELIIHNDGTDTSYDEVGFFLQSEWKGKHSFSRYSTHLGKANYWEIINNAFGQLMEYEFDYVIQLPDDVQLVDNFFEKAVNTFESIPDKYVSCVNLLNDTSRKSAMWTPIETKLMFFPKGKILRTGWVDMCYIANRYFFKILDYKILPVSPDWSANPTKSSGVGKQISETIYKNGTYFYQVITSLVFHGTHDSVMHPEHRKYNKLITTYNLQDVIAGVASMPEREASLKETVNSIINQVGTLCVYLNGYTKVPDFLKSPKIQVFRSNNEAGDLGDVGKFFGLFDAENKYCFTIDDDLIYSNNYVATLITSIEKYGRKNVISSHGRTFETLPVTSYYHGHTKAVACLREQTKDMEVHIAGTGVMAWHSSTMQLSLDDFKAINMADIWIGVKCQENNIPLISIAHSVGFVIESKKYNKDQTIYNFCHRNDSYQTQIINENTWNFLTQINNE